MSTRVWQVRGASSARLRAGMEAIREEQGLVVDFPPQVEDAARRAAGVPGGPAGSASGGPGVVGSRRDLTDVAFVTVDPVGAMDLDQALHLERAGAGYVVRYAIADVRAFVVPESPVDEESHRRGESLYAPDHKIPLHPKVLSEDAASLLPGGDRPAFVWTLRLDGSGEITEARVERAVVRSRARLDYEGAQREIDAAADPDGPLALLREVGMLRVAREADRGGISLPLPAQEIEVQDGRWHLEFREMLPVESWNAQLSLMTGFAAAGIMLEGGVGVVRTLPPPPEGAVSRLRRTARGLGIEWPSGLGHAELIRGLDPRDPAHVAMVVASTSLLRGAGYAAFDGTPPEQVEHAALASPYAHVTAPLRRLVDRYGLEACAALCADEPVPDWVRGRLGDLPGIMRESGRRASAYENAVIDLVEAEILRPRVGERFAAVVTEADEDERSGSVIVREPAVEARVSSAEPLPVGEEVTVTLVEADPGARRVRFTL